MKLSLALFATTQARPSMGSPKNESTGTELYNFLDQQERDEALKQVDFFNLIKENTGLLSKAVEAVS